MFTKNNTEDKFVEIKYTEPMFPYGTHITGKRANPNRSYIKRLAACRDYASMREIYPGVKNPLSDEMFTLWGNGFVKKYTKPQFIKKHTVKVFGIFPHTYTTYSRVWYKITSKGEELLRSVGV